MSTLWKSLFKTEDQVPAELKDLTPEQVTEKIKAFDSQATELEKLKNSVAEKDKKTGDLTNEMTVLKRKLAEIEENGAPPKSKETPVEIPSVLEDEDSAFNGRLAPIQASAMQANAQIALMRAEQYINNNPVDARLLRRYKQEVDRMFFAQPLQYQMNPQTYLNCFNNVMGAKRSEIDSLRGTENDPFVEPAGGGAPPQQPKNDELSADEVRVAQRMGITPEQYMNSKKESTLVSG